MKQYVVDAFTDRIFGGNPAAVCVLGQWPTDEMMQSIAAENNLSETAFAVAESSEYRLRWFTPGGEIDLCGHATLAAAYVVLNFVHPGTASVTFQTRSGPLTVQKNEDLYEMDFPAYALQPVPVTAQMSQALGATPSAAYLGRDLLCVFDSAETVVQLRPDMEKLKHLDGLLLQITAPGTDVDCISRSFAPKLNVPEDPVCGSGHCHIAPYWSGVLQKKSLVAYQASPRGGTLYCTVNGERVILSGKAALYSVAELQISL